MKTRLCMIQGGHFSASKGGAQYQAEVLVDQLVKEGDFEVTYITRQADNTFIPTGYRIEKISTPKAVRKFGFWLDAVDIYRRLKRIKPHTIYQQGLRGHTGIAARYAKTRDTKLVFQIASDFDVLPAKELAKSSFSSGSRIDKCLGEYGLRAADLVVAQTTVQNELMSYHYDRKADLIVRNFHPPASGVTDQSSTNPRVIWIANFKEVKRPELFVKLAENLCNLECKFIMIGRPGDERKYADLHRRMQNLDNLSYLGELSQKEVNAEIEKSHILVNTSLFEGFPNTFIQAWMRGLPVVTLGLNTDRLFDAKKIGICEDTFEEMQKTVSNLVTDTLLRENMSKATIEYAEKYHSMSVIKPLVEALRHRS